MAVFIAYLLPIMLWVVAVVLLKASITVSSDCGKEIVVFSRLAIAILAVFSLIPFCAWGCLVVVLITWLVWALEFNIKTKDNRFTRFWLKK